MRFVSLFLVVVVMSFAVLADEPSSNELSGKNLPKWLKSAVETANKNAQRFDLTPVPLTEVVFVKDIEVFIVERNLVEREAEKARQAAAFMLDSAGVKGKIFFKPLDPTYEGWPDTVRREVVVSMALHEFGHLSRPGGKHSDCYKLQADYLILAANALRARARPMSSEAASAGLLERHAAKVNLLRDQELKTEAAAMADLQQ